MAEDQGHIPSRGEAWHALAHEEIAERLAADREVGLDEEEVARRREKWGLNLLAEAPPEALWKKFLDQFRELVIWILIVAAVISGALGEWIDTVAILAIVLLNAILGFVQEERAGRAIAALRKLANPMAKATRSGKPLLIPASELVPGDLIHVEAGDYVPADARLIEAFAAEIQEAALTGESLPVQKDAGAQLPADAPLADRLNMIYMGTVASAGKAAAFVAATGMNTELGRIAGLLKQAEIEPTPLQRRLGEVGRVLVYLCLSLVTVIFCLELWEAWRAGEPLREAATEVFLTAVSLAVAAVPEGLPAVVTLALAFGLQRMVKRNALIRKLPSVETLGSVTVICSDKTGTLTRNEMTLQKLAAAGHTYEITGAGYAPEGDFTENGQTLAPLELNPLKLALTVAARCNNAKLVKNEKEGVWEIIGDPTEGALLVAARKAGLDGGNGGKLIHEIPFDSERKLMSVVFEEAEGGTFIYSKGAPEVLLKHCDRIMMDEGAVPFDDARRTKTLDDAARMAAGALRVLALAYAPATAVSGAYEEKNLIFLALAGMKDPARNEAQTAVGKCHEAGIRPVMITGDHPLTASAIASELGIATEGEQAVSGQDLDQWTDAELNAQAGKISVYARVTAAHKLRIIKALKNQGHIVAMTGDGVNDAPAIKAADIGIAMGITGTDVTKEAADMVLMDDNFASIVNAVEEGRGIYDNIQKFIHFLLSCNAGEVLFMFAAALLGWPIPLAAVHLLWINLVTDGFPALALGLEPPEPDIMKRPPRPPREPIITLKLGWQMFAHGTIIAAVTLMGFGWIYVADPSQIERARTVAFLIMVYSELFYSLACRSQRFTMPQLGFFSNPYLFAAIAISAVMQGILMATPFAQRIFETTPGFHNEWVLILGLSLVPVTLIELAKVTRAAFHQPA